MRAKAHQSRREVSRVALAFAYDGTAFESFARQPRRRTVEGELLRALAKSGAIREAATARYEVASRTDAGVSAAWNVCAFDTHMDPRRLAHIHHEVEGLWLLSAASVPAGFSPRRQAVAKRYVYHVLKPTRYDWDRIREGARAFVGQHDFRNFCRPDRDVPTQRTLSALHVEPGLLTFEAPNFLWEQVRRITHALLDIGLEASALDDAQRRLTQPHRRDPQAPAPAAGLVLDEVRLGIEFPPPSKSAARLVRSRAEAARWRSRFYDRLAAKAPIERR